MNISIQKNKLTSKPQVIELSQPITTLIGENGCGKSAILEQILHEYLEKNDISVICFGSGQNESFSPIFNRYKTKSKRFEIANSINEESLVKSFYFNNTWIRFLVFFSTILRPNGLVRNFLVGREYIDETDGERKDDRSTKLYFFVRVLKRYINDIQFAIKKEETEFNFKSIRTSFFHRILTSFIEQIYSANYDFDTTVRCRGTMLDTERVFKAFGAKATDIFAFLSYGTQSDRFIYLNGATLRFKRNLELNDLSDGEVQLLSIYALIDLFDSNQTLFLLDEVDSHLYYENSKKLWAELGKIKGHAITTTHSADSIISNKFENIRLIKNGIAENNVVLDAINNRLESLTKSEKHKYQFAGKVRFIALVEDLDDWHIFKKLAAQKGLDITLLENIQGVKCSSGYNTTTEDFGKSKKQWVNKFIDHNQEFISTESIFMICDRDNLPLADFKQDGVSLIGEARKAIRFGNNKNAYLLCWKRRQIENYLCCYSLLNSCGVLDKVNELLPTAEQITPNSPCDSRQLQDAEVKNIIKPFYLHDKISEGVSIKTLNSLIEKIPSEEISIDIDNMYNFIIGKLN